MVAPRAASAAGYDPSGRYLAVQPRGAYRPHEVLDVRTGEQALRIDRDADASWVAEHTLLLRMDGTSLYVDVASGRRWHAEDRRLDSAPDVYPTVDGTHAGP